MNSGYMTYEEFAEIAEEEVVRICGPHKERSMRLFTRSETGVKSLHLWYKAGEDFYNGVPCWVTGFQKLGPDPNGFRKALNCATYSLIHEWR